MPRAPNIRVGEHYESLRAAFPMTIYFDYNNVLNSGGERCFHNRTFFLSMLSDFIALLRQGPMSVFSPQICLLSFAPSGHRRESVLRELDEADVIRAFHKIVFTMERTTGHDPSFPKETRILLDDPRIIKYSAGKDDYIASQGHLQSDLVFFVEDKFQNLDAAIELLPTLYAIEMRLRRRHELNIGDRRGSTLYLIWVNCMIFSSAFSNINGIVPTVIPNGSLMVGIVPFVIEHWVIFLEERERLCKSCVE